MNINSIGSSGVYGTSDLGPAFASALTKRLQAGQKPDDSGESGGVEAARKEAELSKLESALAGTVAYMSAEHGQKAATTMIALVMKRIGGDDISEDNLGEAFLDVIRFVDANFGTDKGDKLMAHLNGSLNRSMNDFFDNGLNESFMVAPANFGVSTVAADAMSEAAQGISEIYAQAVKSLLEAARVQQDETGKSSPYALQRQDEMMKGVLSDRLI